MKNENTKHLWDAIKKMGRFSDSYYDKCIESEMKSELGIIKNESLQDLQPEVVFNAFLKVMSPLSMMYEDILYLFECCKANKSSKNIEIEFESNQSVITKFNIQHFIEARRKFEEVKISLKKITFIENKVKNIWSLHSGSNHDKREIKNKSFQDWNDEYWNEKDKWPEGALDFKEVARSLPVAELLLRSFECWQALFDFYKSTDRENWQVCIDKYKGVEESLLYCESDYCLGSILFDLYYLAEHYLTFSDTEKEETRKRLTEFLEVFEISDGYVKKNIQVWQEFLKLPVWEKRYEVYSIWVFTQIIDAFPDEYVTFNIKDGQLIFPFSGANLADISINDRVFHVWTELRTKAIVKPVGESRKKAVQPDYSIVYGDEKNIEDTIAVVECKQYKKANIKNFSEAMIDYALNRPNAKVLLADYGDINYERIITAVKEIPGSRYNVFSKYRPQSENVAKFSEIIRESLYLYADVFKLDPQYAMEFVLTWDGISEMQDYDLYMNFIHDDGIQELSYRKQDIESSEYSGDIQNSPGEECIRINKWEQGVYDIWVHNYSEDINFMDGKPAILVKAEDFRKTIEMRYKKTDSTKLNWWHILKVDTRLNIGFIINKMENKYSYS